MERHWHPWWRLPAWVDSGLLHLMSITITNIVQWNETRIIFFILTDPPSSSKILIFTDQILPLTQKLFSKIFSKVSHRPTPPTKIVSLKNIVIIFLKVFYRTNPPSYLKIFSKIAHQTNPSLSLLISLKVFQNVPSTL